MWASLRLVFITLGIIKHRYEDEKKEDIFVIHMP